MARPSQNVDQRLLEAGLALLPQTGCAGLSVRRLADHAGVNLGMFHYHFKNKATFVRAVLQHTYEVMFSALTLRVDPNSPPLANLRRALTVLARFGREHRHLLVRIAADAMAGEPLAAEFLRANLPRHVAVLMPLVRQLQRERVLVRMPPPQVIAFLAGAVGAPVIIGGAMQLAAGDAPVAALLERHVLSNAAIARRIELALRGLAAPEKTA